MIAIQAIDCFNPEFGPFNPQPLAINGQSSAIDHKTSLQRNSKPLNHAFPVLPSVDRAQ
jgi:hypothetical protein